MDFQEPDANAATTTGGRHRRQRTVVMQSKNHFYLVVKASTHLLANLMESAKKRKLHTGKHGTLLNGHLLKQGFLVLKSIVILL